MSFDIKHQVSGAVVALGAGVKNGHFFLLWWQSVVRSWQRRKMIAALSALDDHILHDIGIHRGEIELFVDRLDDRELRMIPVVPEPKSLDLTYADLRRAA